VINAEITYGSKSFMAKVKGHAGFAPKGQDIVCAGVSALAMALYKAASLFVVRESTAYYSVEINDGCFEIRIFGIRDPEIQKKLEMFFVMFYSGLCEIENQHPDYLKVNLFDFPSVGNDNDTSEQTMKTE